MAHDGDDGGACDVDEAIVTTRVVLIDDHTLFRETLRRLLETEGRYAVVGEFATRGEFAEALQRGGSERLGFDLALVDYQLGSSENGVSMLHLLRDQAPSAAVLMVTAGLSSGDLLAVVRELRVGVFLKSEPASELLLAMGKAMRGELWVSSGAALALLAEEDRYRSRGPEGTGSMSIALIKRERSVLRRILEGLSNKEIGAQLDLSESLVKSVVQRLFEKLGVRSRSQLVRVAIESQMDLESAE